MVGADISEWQPGTVDLSKYDFVIIRTSHGTTEDKNWREHFNHAVQTQQATGKPEHLGFYHFAEGSNVVAEANFFKSLVGGGWVSPGMGWWLDTETGQSETWVDQFRQVFGLLCGVYSNLDGFHNKLHHAYDHFYLNWFADPSNLGGVDWIMKQTGINDGIDADTSQGILLPPAWGGAK